MDSNQNHSTEIEASGIGKEPIGVHKYNCLKSLPVITLTEQEISDIEFYESKQEFKLETNEYKKKYVEKLFFSEPETAFTFTAMDLWKIFKGVFLNENRKEFIKNDLTVKNIEPLIYYFSKDERFFQCENLTQLSPPSFNKGLLIVGGFGNGKTACMQTFEKIFQRMKGMSFKGYSANEVVKYYERGSGEALKEEFERSMFAGNRYFDDVKTEREASNYGKVNLFKEILEARYVGMRQKGSEETRKTFITCNYKEGYFGNMEMALDEFGEKYGARVYDRIFEMFNIVEFKGTSFRK